MNQGYASSLTICRIARFIAYYLMSDSLSFGAWLKQRRRALDLTQQELAQRTACSLSTLRKIESDDLIPSKELAQLLAEAVGVSAAEQDAFVAFARGAQVTFAAPAQLQATPAATSSTVVTLPKATPTGYYLPTPLTGLVGRERELQSGCALLRLDHVRLLTLVGPPGAGKTRLSLALAKALQREFAHGACFVPLAPISDPTLVLAAIAQTLQVRESAGESLLATLQALLSQQQLLLVLDNFEQVVDAAPDISELLTAAPELKIIVSSRETLKLYGEYEFPVAPLAIPDIHHLPSAALLEMYPAVELFVQRARAVRPDFAITRDNGATVAQICAWLDGLPLAIEMAAARIKWQNPATLLDQLRSQLLALTGGPRDLTPRQQTLRGAMDWSYNLLTLVEQKLFIAFGVINGSSTAAALAALTDLDEALVNGLLLGLVEKSLLQYSVDEQGKARYTMLQMVREYAQAKQREQGVHAELQARHAAFYSRLVAASLPQLQTDAAEQVLKRLTLEHTNLRSALTWQLQTTPVAGLQLATLLANSLWGIRGYFSEGRSWLEKFLAAAPKGTHQQGREVGHLTAATNAWLAAARMALGQGDLPAAATFATASERLALTLEEDSAVRAALRCRAAIALHQSDYEQATQLYQQALELCRPERDQLEAAAILNGLGLIAKDQGDYARALALHEESQARYADAGDTIGMARSLTYASIAAYWQGDYLRSIDLARQVITLQHGIGDVVSLSYSREIEAMALVRLGQLAAGMQILEECLGAFEEQDDRAGVATVLVDLGQAAYRQQDYVHSFAYHARALGLAHSIGDRRRAAFALEGMGVARAYNATTTENLTEAVQFLAAASTLRHTIGAPLPAIERTAYEEALTLASTHLAPTQYDSAWQNGAAISVAQIVQSYPQV
ncbi:MAG: tetratricopeptide repeat protein [Caldilineaceae bacterium]